MRVMLRARLDTQIANELIEDGTLPKLMQSVMERIQPEAAYFHGYDGGRACTLVFDMRDSSQLPSIAESFFQKLGAEVEITPAMNVEDMQKGLAAL
ncbi:hypothetical protein BJF79_29345 [Actinomadura sp. CNU-125]|uniref:DUF3303 family protein n=1 Tax=Actinomadura sp. CNU-125 TaxID=1904961 RepID=UPI00095DDD4E|nr:DUF3303 family protein [Actinomadura sp. CNU-125]OLT37614.1 hypothetical protein BJF79_29345 [Actinomadura sp. CNU-125]